APGAVTSAGRGEVGAGLAWGLAPGRLPYRLGRPHPGRPSPKTSSRACTTHRCVLMKMVDSVVSHLLNSSNARQRRRSPRGPRVEGIVPGVVDLGCLRTGGRGGSHRPAPPRGAAATTLPATLSRWCPSWGGPNFELQGGSGMRCRTLRAGEGL